jgi:hypothetical protein
MAVFTPQRAAYPLHQDNYIFQPDAKVLSGVIDQLKEEGRWPEELEQYRFSFKDHRGFFHKTQASFNDPMSIFYVLDMVVKSQRGHYIRPGYLTPALRDLVPAFYWNANVVGRILAGIQVACEWEYGSDHAIQSHENENGERAEAYDKTWVPFAKGRDAKGAYYVIDPRGGNEGLLWLAALRSRFYQLSEMLMRNEQAGEFDPEGIIGKGMVAHDFISEHAPGAIRSKAGYLAQVHPGRRFSHVLYEPEVNPATFYNV